MSNPQYGFNELAAAQAQPEVTVNLMVRMISQAVAGEIVIDFASDADYELDASNPLSTSDEWPYGTITMTDTGNVLTQSRSVIFPDLVDIYGAAAARHRFIFRNDTAQSLTIKGDGMGAVGVDVEPSQSALVQYDGEDVVEVAAGGGGGGGGVNSEVILQLAASEFGEAIQAGDSVAYLRSPKAFTITDARASLFSADSTSDIEIDIKVNGVSIFTTPITIDQGERTSTTADVPPVIDDGTVPDDAEITVDVDGPTSMDATGLIVTLIGTAS